MTYRNRRLLMLTIKNFLTVMSAIAAVVALFVVCVMLMDRAGAAVASGILLILLVTWVVSYHQLNDIEAREKELEKRVTDDHRQIGRITRTRLY